MNRMISILFAMSLITATSALSQIPLQYRYQNRQNRWEGIKSGYQVGGERLQLTSAIFLSDLPASGRPQNILLGFYLPMPEDVAITVRLPKEKYWMEPLNNTRGRMLNCGRGFNKFSWDGAVLRYLKKSVRDLHAIAKIRTSGQRPVLIPVGIYDDSAPLPLPPILAIQSYRFTFVPNADVDTIDYKVKSPDDRILLFYQLIDMPANAPFTIKWEPGENEDGEYSLILRTVFLVKDKPNKIQSYLFNFQHTRAISTTE